MGRVTLRTGRASEGLDWKSGQGSRKGSHGGGTTTLENEVDRNRGNRPRGLARIELDGRRERIDRR